MSLRREVHSAFDEIAPPLAGMPERVVQTVLVHQATRRRKERMLLRFRAPLSLVAVLAVIALVAAVLVGGRLMRDWSMFQPESPAGPVHRSLATLESRPIVLPQVAANAACPAGPLTGGVYGNGPFYGDPTLTQGDVRTAWGVYWNLVAETDRNASGLMLVRALDVKTRQAYVFAGPYAAGAAAGTDTVAGQTLQRRSEMVFDTAHPPSATSNGRTLWSFRLGVPAGGSGCYGWQIDGDNFTETFIFNVS